MQSGADPEGEHIAPFGDRHRRQVCRRSVEGATLLSPVLHRSSSASLRPRQTDRRVTLTGQMLALMKMSSSNQVPAGAVAVFSPPRGQPEDFVGEALSLVDEFSTLL